MTTELVYEYYCPRCEDKFEQDGRREEAPCPTCGTLSGARGFLIDGKGRYEDSMGRKVNSLTSYVLRDRHDFVIDFIKSPLRKHIIRIANRLPFGVTKDNASLPNTYRILDTGEWFFSQLKRNKNTELYMIGKERADMFRAIFKLVAFVIEHDPWMRFIANRVFWHLIEIGWDFDTNPQIHHKYWAGE
jgi:hypothetical protein